MTPNEGSNVGPQEIRADRDAHAAGRAQAQATRRTMVCWERWWRARTTIRPSIGSGKDKGIVISEGATELSSQTKEGHVRFRGMESFPRELRYVIGCFAPRRCASRAWDHPDITSPVKGSAQSKVARRTPWREAMSVVVRARKWLVPQLQRHCCFCASSCKALDRNKHIGLRPSASITVVPH